MLLGTKLNAHVGYNLDTIFNLSPSQETTGRFDIITENEIHNAIEKRVS